MSIVITIYCNLSPTAEDILVPTVIPDIIIWHYYNYVILNFEMAIAILATLKISAIDWLIDQCK